MINDLLQLINFAAAFNGVGVALVILSQERTDTNTARMELGGFILIISILLGFFVLFDMAIVAPLVGLEIILNALAVLGAGLFLNYVRGTIGQDRYAWVSYLPAVAFLIASIMWRQAAPLWVGVTGVVLLQVAFTGIATGIYFGARRRLPTAWATRAENRHLPLLFSGVYALHVAQVLRIFNPQNSLVFDLVPLVGAAGLFSFCAYALFGSQTIAQMVVRSGSPLRLDAPATSAVARMKEDRLFLDPDLSLRKAAAHLGYTPRDLSTLLNDGLGKSFREVTNDLRVAEAQRLLTSLDEAQTSIEAIALLSGFRSRSTFYEAFKMRTGKTPAEFRSG